MKNLKFEDVRDQIVTAIQNRSNVVGIVEDVTLLEGFFNDPLRDKLVNAPVIGGDYWYPMIALVGDKSGRVYLFSVKELLKDEINS